MKCPVCGDGCIKDSGTKPGHRLYEFPCGGRYEYDIFTGTLQYAYDLCPTLSISRGHMASVGRMIGTANMAITDSNEGSLPTKPDTCRASCLWNNGMGLMWQDGGYVPCDRCVAKGKPWIP